MTQLSDFYDADKSAALEWEFAGHPIECNPYQVSDTGTQQQ